MLLEKQKTNPNKMANNVPQLQILENTKNVVFSLMVLSSILLIVPTVFMVIILGMTGTIKFSTSLILGMLFILFYIVILYSIYLVLYYYLTPFEQLLSTL